MRNRSKFLGASVLALAMAGAGVSAAQAQAYSEADEAVSLGELVVTGTRLRRPSFQGTNPVSSVGAEAMANAGVTNVTDFLLDMPALVASTTLQDNANAGDMRSSGVNFLDLRNLGVQRTLVLVNGRRHVAASIEGASVDINSIPVALIERVDVLTGGASAIYGADGVTGVVNFVLKKDFEGLDIRAQYGNSEDGGGENSFVSVLAGHNTDDGRVNFTLGLEHNKTRRLAREDRYFASLEGRENVIQNPKYGQAGEYRRIFTRNARYTDTSPGGSVYTDFDFADSLSGVDFNGDGTPFRDGQYGGGFSVIGGDGSQLAAFQTDMIPELERMSVQSTFNIELAPRHHAFGEFKFSRSETAFQSQPTFDYGLIIPIDNPFIPATIRAAALAAGGLAEPGVGMDAVLMARDNFDLGPVQMEITRDTYRGVFGVRGELTSRLNYEMSLNYGRLIEDNMAHNVRNNERYFAAIDAVRDGAGNIVCRSTLDPTAAPLGNYELLDKPYNRATFGSTFRPGANSGCVPINLFGHGSPSAEALNWIMGDDATRTTLEQFVFNGFVSGETAPVSFLAGPISYSAGVEYRREEANHRTSAMQRLSTQLGQDLNWMGQGVDMSANFDVKEVFGEVSIPLLADRPFVRELSLEGAYRLSDYSTIGKAEAYKVGLMWAPNDSLFLRATGARSVRAPNMGELFRPRQQTHELLFDPCDKDEVTTGVNPAVREANCRAMLGIGTDVPYTWTDTNSSSVEGVISGNAELKAEEADTLTLGFVLTPRAVPGLSVALDYYDIKLSNAIQFFEAQSIVDKCYDLPQPNQFCDLITRESGTHLLKGFEQYGVNVAEYRTSGWDLTADYLLQPSRFGIERDVGTFRFTLTGSKLDTLEFIEEPGNPLSAEDTVGAARTPEWQANLDVTWNWRSLAVNYGYNWFDETRRYENVAEDFIDPRYLNHDARSTHDLQLRYEVRQDVSVYGGVNNLTNQLPSRGTVDYPVSALGRYFYMGVNLKL